MTVREAGQTRRRELIGWLSQQEWSFDALRRDLGISVRLLEEDLRHVERTLHGSGRSLLVTPPRCAACDFVFRGRAPRRFHTPSRCPRCRSEAIEAARLRVGDR
jgi:predicted Zn-ribbon and HTH transcriptional regulator